MSVIFPSNDKRRLANMRSAIRVAASQLSSQDVSIPEAEVSELRAAYGALQEDIALEENRKLKLKRMRAMVSQRMPHLREQVRAIWGAARFYIDNIIREQAMLRAFSDSQQSSKPGEPDGSGDAPDSASSVEAEAVRSWYKVPLGSSWKLDDVQWVDAARHLARAMQGASEVNMPVFQAVSADQILMVLDGLDEAVLFIAQDRSNRSARRENSREVRERVHNVLVLVASSIRYACRGASVASIREKQRAFGFEFRVGSASSSDSDAPADNPVGSGDSAGEEGDESPIIQPEPNLEAESSLG